MLFTLNIFAMCGKVYLIMNNCGWGRRGGGVNTLLRGVYILFAVVIQLSLTLFKMQLTLPVSNNCEVKGHRCKSSILYFLLVLTPHKPRLSLSH